MTDQEFFLNFYQVKRNDEAGGAGFAVELQICVQLAVHYSIGEMRINVPRVNDSRAKVRRKRKNAIIKGGVQWKRETREPFFKILQLKRIHYHVHTFFDTLG